MFVIVYQNSVILGPMRWNRFRFENVIFEDCEEFSVTLADRNDDLNAVIVSEDIKILPIQGTPDPLFNPKIERLQGPFWDFSNDVATSSYVVESLPIESVKNQLKAELANERYTKEVSGVQVTIQNTDITVDTARGTRENLTQKYLLMGESETTQWKFPQAWLTLTKTEVGQLVTTAANHVQSQFEWENSIINQIDQAETLEQLDSIVFIGV